MKMLQNEFKAIPKLSIILSSETLGGSWQFIAPSILTYINHFNYFHLVTHTVSFSFADIFSRALVF